MIDDAIVNAPALGGGGELTTPSNPGWLAIGVRYLHIDLGRTSAGDQSAATAPGSSPISATK